MNKGCLVTGAAGFIGSHLVDKLLSMGYEVVGVDNLLTGSMDNLVSAQANHNFHFYKDTVRKATLLRELKEMHQSISVVFHLAAISEVPYSMSHRDETLWINYVSTLFLLNDSERFGIESLVFAGSAAEYGDFYRGTGIREGDANEYTEQPSPYGYSKYLASRAVSHSSVGVSLRLFNVYGPRQKNGVIPIFVRKAANGESLTVHGSGNQTRDFVYISDVVDAFIAAIGKRGIYNVGGGSSVKVFDIIGALNQLLNKEISVFFDEPREGDIEASLADSKLFRGVTGWSPSVSLHEGLKKMLEDKQCTNPL